MYGTEPHEVTPIFTEHARARCEEMKISTKVAKHVWRTRTLTRGMAGHPNRVLATSTADPEYVVVADLDGWAGRGGPPVVITVLYVSEETYLQSGRNPLEAP